MSDNLTLTAGVKEVRDELARRFAKAPRPREADSRSSHSEDLETL